MERFGCGMERVNLREGDVSVEVLWLWVGWLGDKRISFFEPNALRHGGIPTEAPPNALLRRK